MSVIVEPQVFQVVPDDNTANYIPMSMGLAKGDILVCASPGTFQRLPVGTSGQVLTVNPDAELGIEWADPT